MQSSIELLRKQGNPAAERIKKAAIIGLPNTGKSHIFNGLTGEYSIVANYPGTTIEMKRAEMRINGQGYEIIDTPGLHCLSIHSEEEIAVRTMLLEEAPDVIIQCIDASQLKQSLMLTADLLELEIPLCICLNANGEAKRRGAGVDSQELARFLGVPVVDFITLRKGCDELKQALTKARKGSASLTYGYSLESAITEIAALLPFELGLKHKIASFLLMEDSYMKKYLEERFSKDIVSALLNEASALRRKFRNNIQSEINRHRGLWVDKAVAACVRRGAGKLAGVSHYAAQASRHPILGIPIFLFAMATLYISVVYASGFLETQINNFIVNPALKAIGSLALPVFWNDFLIGDHGLLTIGIFNAVCTVLPILSVFFLVFALFEDSGYIANFCVFSKRIFEKIGMTGKAIIPLVLGFGCKSMATLSARGLSSRKEKFITIFLIAFAIPCSAQLGINIAILAKVGLSALLIAFGILALVELAAGLVLNKLIKEECKGCFIQPLPPMRLPSLRQVCIKTFHRIASFFKEALPIFVISAIGLFILEKIGALDAIKQALSPVIVGWMGLPKDILDVFILALARREAAAGRIFHMVSAGALNYIQSIVAVVVTTTFFPCFANVIAIGKEIGARAAVLITVLICLSSFILAGALRWVLVLAFGH